MSKKAKIILGIVLGIVGLFIVVVVGGSILGAALSSRSYTGLESEYPTSEKSLSQAPSADFFGSESELSAPEAYEEGVPPTAVDESVTSQDSGELTEKKVIKTGEIEMTVGSVDATVSDLTGIASRTQGFIQSSYVYESSSGVKSGVVVMKVPVQKFDTIFGEIKELAEVVTSEQVAGQDVTEQYVDLQARLKNAQAEEQQYLEIMKKATEIEDILKVTSALSTVREQIERLEGQIRYLENMTNMSTISVELSEETRVVSEVEKWKPYQTVKKAFKSLIGVLQKTADRLIWVVIFLIGLFLPIGIIIWIIVKIVKRVRRKKQEKQNIPPPQV